MVSSEAPVSLSHQPHLLPMGNRSTTAAPSPPLSPAAAEHYRIPEGFVAVFVGVYAPLVLAILAGNALLLLAVHREKGLRRRCHAFIVSLSVADLLTGLVGVPTAGLGRLLRTPAACRGASRLAFFTAAFTFSAVSVLQLLAVTAERYLAVAAPLAHHTRMTSRRYGLAIAAVWAAGAAVGVLPNFVAAGGADEDVCRADYRPSGAARRFALALAVAIPAALAAMGLMYFHIFRTARRQANRIAALRRTCSRDRGGPPAADHSAQMKATRTTAIILGGFAVCWMPMALKFLLEACLAPDAHAALVLQTVLEFPAYANSAVNPVIYGYRNAEFRAALYKTLAAVRRWRGPAQWAKTAPPAGHVKHLHPASVSTRDNSQFDMPEVISVV